MRIGLAMGSTLLAVALVATTYAADDLKSGPQVGKNIPGAFHPLNVTGASAGKKNCLVWQNGANPVAMIFAREISAPLTSLVKKLDEATAKNKSARMGSFVVFCSDDEGLEQKLKDLAKTEGLKNIVLSIDNPAGPKGYEVAKDADVTVVYYNKRNVKVNQVFKKGELKDGDIEKLVAEVTKIVP